ncbi:5286_t:CDS:2, partial [Dentiscutata heterogama]
VEPDSNFTIVSPYYLRNRGNHNNRRGPLLDISVNPLKVAINIPDSTSTDNSASTDAARRPRPVRGRATTTSAVTSTVGPTVTSVASCNGYSVEGPSPSAPANLDRIDQQTNSLDGAYSYPSSSGSGVNVYIIDTGIYIANQEFGGRAIWGSTQCSGCQDKDDNGHGTNVAGIVGGTTYGVAKNSNLIAVKVCDRSGVCQNSDIISGLSWAAQQHTSGPNKNSVINLSLSGGTSSSLNDAVQQCINQGMHVVTAAGNSADDACNYSPSSAPNCIAVGATDNSAAMASFSNYGTCVDIFAP